VRLEPFVTPYNANRSSLRWSSSNTTIATVDSNGVVTGVKAGSVKITVTNAEGTISAECNMTVRVDTRPVRSISISSRAITLNAGATRTLSISYTPSNATIKGVNWSSNSSAIARVEPDGKIIAVSGGTATITARSDSGAFLAQCVVTVRVPVTAVSLSESAITLRVGETYQLDPILTPTNATPTNTRYSTRSSTIAAVSDTGLITARRTGTTTITVNVDGKTTTCSVRVIS